MPDKYDEIIKDFENYMPPLSEPMENINRYNSK